VNCVMRMLDETVLGPPSDVVYSASFGLRQEYIYLLLAFVDFVTNTLSIFAHFCIFSRLASLFVIGLVFSRVFGYCALKEMLVLKRAVIYSVEL